MGYECPVCGDPQADAGHLANHLAFTAMTSGADHEAWLDDHVPDWGGMGESDLADEVVEYAEETDFPQVFDESGVEDHDHGDEQPSVEAARERADRELSDDDAEVLAEARDLTKEMLDADDNETE
jgi:hypothetical protein